MVGRACCRKRKKERKCTRALVEFERKRGVERVVVIGGEEQSIDALHDFPDRGLRSVVPIQDRVADAPMRVDVAVLDWREEAESGRAFWIASRKGQT